MKRNGRNMLSLGLMLALASVSATTPAFAQEGEGEVCGFLQKLENWWNTGGKEWNCGN